MKFALIVCTYQRPKALVTLLESVVLQQKYPDEIIIVDGSKDDKTTAILEENTYKNLRYFKVSEKDRGLTKQRNYGITKVSEAIEIVCFLDDDIVLTPSYFETLLSTYTLYPEAIGVGGYIINETSWRPLEENEVPNKSQFSWDNWVRGDGSRFVLRKKLGLDADVPPGYMPDFSHGRSVGFLPPSGKTYQVEQLMGGVASYPKHVLDTHKFSEYFEGYGLYEDADYTLRLSKRGALYLNTGAQLYHYHEASGRPNQFSYGKMVVRNGWYVWRVKHPNPSLKARFKWNATSFVLTVIRYGNFITTTNRKEALTEALGRTVGWFSLLVNKPTIQEA